MRKTILAIFGFFCLMVGIVFILFNYVVFPKKYSNIIFDLSSEYNIDSALVFAIIKAESNFNENAVSKAGAKGLMQILPSTASWIAEVFDEEYSDDLLFEAKTNIKYGCFYLRYLTDKFKNLEAVVCAYNAGESVVRNWLDDKGEIIESEISYNETKNYLKKVKYYYQIYS